MEPYLSMAYFYPQISECGADLSEIIVQRFVTFYFSKNQIKIFQELNSTTIVANRHLMNKFQIFQAVGIQILA